MVEEDKYCIDILTQVAAATKALQSVALGLLEEHLGHCVVQAVTEGGDTAADKVSIRCDRPASPVLTKPGEAARRRSRSRDELPAGATTSLRWQGWAPRCRQMRACCRSSCRLDAVT
jgi:hypothetical protein